MFRRINNHYYRSTNFWLSFLFRFIIFFFLFVLVDDNNTSKRTCIAHVLGNVSFVPKCNSIPNGRKFTEKLFFHIVERYTHVSEKVPQNKNECPLKHFMFCFVTFFLLFILIGFLLLYLVVIVEKHIRTSKRRSG